MASSSYSIVLPPDDRLLGITFVGSGPPKVENVSFESKLRDKIKVGSYIQTLVVPGRCEMSFIPNATTLLHHIRSFQDVGRNLIIRDAPISGPPTWKIDLPASKDLGITLKGFPPIIDQIISDTAAATFKGVPLGVTVDRVVVPGVCDLSLASGGFTDANVTKALVDSQGTAGRYMVLVDGPHLGKTRQTKTHTPVWDSDGWNLPRKKWWNKKKMGWK